jgi:hypothetical protein
MARMPSTRAKPLNPRLGHAPVPSPAMSAAARMPLPPTRSVPVVLPPAPVHDEEDEREEQARAGGFHESSYELKQGLDVTESEWPPDTTVPGSLAPR